MDTPALDTVRLSLISHTNVGKTTLARTLLRRDVGEVLDQAHVTEQSEAYPLLEVDGARLELWDTPGFGDTARLMRRLRDREHPLRWLLAQAWDRIADRPLWSSQEAVRHIQESSDVVLYLVNAAEAPADAGYVRLELDLLTWIGRPVLLLLNQTGDVAPGSPRARKVRETWQHHVAFWPIVQEVQPLDAFTRCWAQEGILLSRVVQLLPEERRPLMERLAAAWNQHNLEVLEASAGRMASYLLRTAAARHPLPSGRPSRADRQQAMTRLAETLESDTQRLMDALIDIHGLEGRSSSALRKSIEDFLVSGTTELTVEKGALLGGALSGAVGGLAADFMSGGLTFGGGLVAGAILGALGGAGLTRAYEMVKLSGEPAVSWSPVFLDELARQVLLRYLAVAHFGRGRGSFQDQEHPAFWKEATDRALSARTADLRRYWQQAPETEGDDTVERSLRGLLRERIGVILADAYPAARPFLAATRRP